MPSPWQMHGRGECRPVLIPVPLPGRMRLAADDRPKAKQAAVSVRQLVPHHALTVRECLDAEGSWRPVVDCIVVRDSDHVARVGVHDC